MPKKRLSEAQIEHLSKTKSPRWLAKYRAARQNDDEKRALKGYNEYIAYLESSLEKKNPEKTLDRMALNYSVTHGQEVIKRAQRVALACGKLPLDRRREYDNYIQFGLDLRMAGIYFDAIKLQTKPKYYDKKQREWLKKVYVGTKYKIGQGLGPHDKEQVRAETHQLLETLKQRGEETKEVGTLNLKVATDNPS